MASLRYAALLMLAISFNGWAQELNIRPTPSTPPPDDWGDSVDTRRNRPDDTEYRYGEEIYVVKLGCRNCPFANLPPDEAIAHRYFSEDSLRGDLSDREDHAVRRYLHEKFPIAR